MMEKRINYLMENKKTLRMLTKCLIFLVFLSSCGDKHQQQFMARLDNSYKAGYRFYESVNLIERRGEKEINIYKDSLTLFPFYGLLKKDDKIYVMKIISPESDWTREYKIVDSFLLSTEILKNSELNSFYSRDVTIVNSQFIINYEYFIQDNYEYLQEISIEDSNGLVRSYRNNKDVFYNYSFSFSEKKIKKDFPSLELAK